MLKKENLEIDLVSQEGVMNFLRNPTIKISEALTGILISDNKDWKLSTCNLVQAAIKGQLLTQFGRELNRYIEEGKIKEDYFATNRSRATLYELLKFLDQDIPDDEIFKAAKSIFFSAVSREVSELDEALAYEFLQTIKKLSGTEILILKANNSITDEYINSSEYKHNPSHRGTWRRLIANKMGYGDLDSIVEKYELNLELLGLIAPRLPTEIQEGQFSYTGTKVRLTVLGQKFCNFIIRYE